MERCPFCGSEDIYYSKKGKYSYVKTAMKLLGSISFLQPRIRNRVKNVLDLFFSYDHDKSRGLIEQIKQALEKEDIASILM